MSCCSVHTHSHTRVAQLWQLQFCRGHDRKRNSCKNRVCLGDSIYFLGIRFEALSVVRYPVSVVVVLLSLSALLFSLFSHSFSLFSRSLFPFYRLRYSKFTTRTALVCIKTIPAFIINFKRFLLLLLSGPLCHAPLCPFPAFATHSQRQRRSIKGTRSLLPRTPDCYGGNQIDPGIALIPLSLRPPLLPQAIACKLCL